MNVAYWNRDWSGTCRRPSAERRGKPSGRAVLEALDKRQGSEDTRTEQQRWHDALQLGWW